MTVSESRRRLSASKAVNDLQAGDLVRRKGHRGVGIVESVIDGTATVAWDAARKDILPVSAFRRIRAIGHDLDRKAL